MIGIVAIDLVHGMQIIVLVLWQTRRRWKDLKDLSPHGVPHGLHSVDNGWCSWSRGERLLGFERIGFTNGISGSRHGFENLVSNVGTADMPEGSHQTAGYD